jgi:hypothetical protein
MPGQRRSAGKRARGSWLPRLAGLGVVLAVAAGAATAYVLAFHPAAPHRTAALPTRVISYQTVGLVTTGAQPGTTANQLLQLEYQNGALDFTPVAQAQQSTGSPQWTADLMGGATYIFIYLPTGQCLSATGSGGKPKLALRHCDLSGAQRWRRTQAAVLNQAHDFYQYANLGDGDCLTQADRLSGLTFAASLSSCSAQKPAGQLLAFWWSTL